jgi:PLP dependent protein
MDPRQLREATARVRSGIRAACLRSGRKEGEVLLVAVTKTVPAEVIQAARSEGLEDFAENYAGELAEKALRIEATWHFIGKLQRGTVHRVAEHADVVHSAEPGRALSRLATRAASGGKVLRCLLQVDFTGGRQGVGPDDVAGTVDSWSDRDGIRLVGLMTLPPWTGDPETTRPYFARLRELRDRVRQAHAEVAELSMGMSGDYEVAVEEGATMVRVGTALFGPRTMSRMPGDAQRSGEG